ncbi:MAG: NAD-dependent epimerase/dehydratase family protein [Planctomycetes bacterium]|nr:NAD-dependent epimerase/dehydratase family protein [Planctomycetota bacterium]
MTVAVTGASGFIGAQLCARLVADGLPVRGLSRRHIAADRAPAGVEQLHGFELDESTDWGRALEGCRTLVHAAARAHVLRDRAVDPLKEFMRTNCRGTMRLAGCARAAGVRRIVFLSSIGVLGNSSHGAPLDEDSPPAPHSPYAVAKREAERRLLEFCGSAGIEVVILRLPLVHGPGAKGNFHQLMRTIALRRWLPLGSIRNRRSLLGIANLGTAVTAVVRANDVPCGIFHLADAETVSTPSIIQELAVGMGVPPRLGRVPPAALAAAAWLVGKSATAEKLIGDLEVDSRRFQQTFSWRPGYATSEGLREMAAAFTATGTS